MEQSTNYNFNLPSKNDETSADIDLISDNFRTVDDIVKQVQDDVSKIPTNLVNGSAEGSLRGINAKAEGNGYIIGQNAVAIGDGTKAIGSESHAEGDNTTAFGYCSHAEGGSTTASGGHSHAEGANTIASGDISHAEGWKTTASGTASHAEGFSTTASGEESHAEGYLATASGDGSHAEGGVTTASGRSSHAEGANTIASGYCQHAQGKFNIEDTNNRYAHIVGNGEVSKNRSNAHTLDWDGNAWFAGDVYVGGTSQDDESATKLSSVATDITQVKEKLDGIEEGANKTIVDTALSTTSTNPIQNKVIVENLDKKVNLTNGTIQGAVDWNTITKTGCYKIQNCTMTADYNAPPNEYVYGVLQVLNSENETGEYRVTQIYIPRSPQRYSLWIRTNNSTTGYNNWADWIPFNNAFQLYTKFSTKADIETGTCTLSAYSDTVFGGSSRETLLNWQTDTSKYYTTGSVNTDGTLSVQGAGNARIINSYNINATGTVGVEFGVSGTGAIKIEIKGGGTTYTSGNISLSTNTQKIQITHATSGITVLNDVEINIYASGETALKIENLLKMTETSTRTFTGNYDLIGNQVTVSVLVDNLQNGGEIALYPLPFVPKFAKSGVCGAFSPSPYSAIYYDIYSTTARIYLNDAPQAKKQLTFYYTV